MRFLAGTTEYLFMYVALHFINTVFTWREERLSRPKLRPWRSMQVLPTSVGGPVIIVCLDTSWRSMTGPRERLAKAGRYVDLLALGKLFS